MCHRVPIPCVLALCLSTVVSAQQASAPPAAADESRAQYPPILANSFVSLRVGHLGYPFSQQHLEPGHTAGDLAVPHIAAQAVLFGHHFGKYVSAQASYMRPVKYVKYRDLDGTGATRSVWMHFGTVTMLARVPLGDRVSIVGEAGLGFSSRNGFELDEVPLIRDAQFASLLTGAGVEYRLSPSLDFVAGAFYLPARARDNHPRTVFSSAGVRYNLRPLSPAQVAETVAAGYHFPKHIVQAGFATDAFGYGANHLFSKTIPVFWGGHVEVQRSVASVHYQRNLFHTRKVFSIDLGASVGRWRTRGGDDFTTVSVFPLLRFTLLRRSMADLYFGYSLAGPTYISTLILDGLHTGRHFTFQDFMALGMFVGPNRRLNLELNLNHYSNGNIFTENAGVKVPLAVKVGYAF